MVNDLLVLAGIAFVAFLTLSILRGFLKFLVVALLILTAFVFLGIRLNWFTEEDVASVTRGASSTVQTVGEDVRGAVRSAGDGVRDLNGEIKNRVDLGGRE